jgi:hypothetical protein
MPSGSNLEVNGLKEENERLVSAIDVCLKS